MRFLVTLTLVLVVVLATGGAHAHAPLDEEPVFVEPPAEPHLTDTTGIPAANPCVGLQAQDVSEIAIDNHTHTVRITDRERIGQVLSWLQAIPVEQAVPHVVERDDRGLLTAVPLGSDGTPCALYGVPFPGIVNSMVLSGPGIQGPLILTYFWSDYWLLLSGDTVLRVTEPPHWSGAMQDFLLDQQVWYDWSDWPRAGAPEGRTPMTALAARYPSGGWRSYTDAAQVDGLLAQMHALKMVRTQACEDTDRIRDQGERLVCVQHYAELRIAYNDPTAYHPARYDPYYWLVAWQEDYYIDFSYYGGGEAFLLDPDEAQALVAALAALGEAVDEISGEEPAGNATGQPGLPWYLAWLPALPGGVQR